MSTTPTLSPYGHVDASAYRRAHGIADQLSMTGEDWLSERDKKSQARAEAAHRKACLVAAAKLEAAAEAVLAMLTAYLECGHEDKMGAGDGRRRIVGDMAELASWLRSVHERE